MLRLFRSNFPEDSVEAPSEAIPAIWGSWDEFVQLSEELEEKAAAISEVAETAADASALRPGFKEIGQTCMACHEGFRQPG